MKAVYWTMKNGQQISVDDMDVDHLRNTLKMIIKNSQKKQTKPKYEFEVNGELASIDADLAALAAIDPELTCTCDSYHICQQCFSEMERC